MWKFDLLFKDISLFCFLSPSLFFLLYFLLTSLLLFFLYILIMITLQIPIQNKPDFDTLLILNYNH